MKRMSGKNISFGMTTNGTLLDEDFIQKVQQYNIAIMVSLTGLKKFMIPTEVMRMEEVLSKIYIKT